MTRAIEVKPLHGHRIWIRFADGAEGEVDLSHLAGRGVFTAWADRKVFESVHVDPSGAIAWNQELELCPDALYLRLTGKAPEDVFPALKTPVDA
jgi:hypothetical protein